MPFPVCEVWCPVDRTKIGINCLVDKTVFAIFAKKTLMDKELLKSVMFDSRNDVMDSVVVERDIKFEEYGNYVFTGIRRAGKSYLLFQRIKQLLSEGIGWDSMLYVNFEDERLAGMKAVELNLLLESHMELYGKRPILFLDEIQNIDGWEKFARRLADSKYRVYITGSNAKMLSGEIQTTLGGRYMNVEVYPYSFDEYLRAKSVDVTPAVFYATEQKAGFQRLFDGYLRYGGFPEGIVLSSKRDYLTSVYQKIYLGDIAARHKVENTAALRIMFKKIAESVKQPLSYNRLANVVSATGVKTGTSTIINYVEYAKDAWLITPVQNIAGKLAERESSPKYYFTDNGILNLFLLDANASLLENIVAIALLRKYGREDSVFFYNRGVELDFYVPDAKLAVQVCWSMSDDATFKRETSSMIKAASVLECETLLIITRDEENTLDISGRKVSVVPVWKWLMEK